MSRYRLEPALTLALVALLWGSMGITCDDLAKDSGETDLPLSLHLEIENSYHFRGGYVAILNLTAVTNAPVQACDLTLSWSSSSVSFAAAVPHPEFDDDGALFAGGQFDAGSISHIVDLRHGSATAVGSVRLALVAMVIDDLAPVTLTLDGEFATPDGEPFTVIYSEPFTVDAGV